MGKTIEAVESLLAVDLGNSRIKLGVWDDDGLHAAGELAADNPGSWREPVMAIWSNTAGAKSRAIVLSSVDPKTARQFGDLALEVCQCEPVRVREDLPLPLALAVENPREVGVDRVCSAAAAYERVQEPCAIASFGTATTIDCVSGDGQFLGGTIMPGLEMSCVALHERTARLPRVAPDSPGGVFGKNTYDAILAGVVFSAVGALREIVERFATDLQSWPKLVITGGAAPLILPHADFVDAHVPDLCLQGVVLAYRRAAGQV